MPNYSDEETRTLTKEMSDKIYNDSYEVTEQELVQDSAWIEATKSVYKELEGVEWSGADEDAAKTGLDLMSRFNYNLTLGTINYTAKLQDADPKTKLAFYYMMDMYDKKDISGNGVMRAFKEMGLDPASYIGIGTLGMGFVGKQAAATTAKTGLKAMLKQGAIKFLQSPTAVAATEGAIYTGVDDIARQDAAIGAGVQDKYSPGQTALATGIGAAAGAGIVKGTQAIGRGISNVVNEQENVLRKNFEEGGSMAGGGTPPTTIADIKQQRDALYIKGDAKSIREANVLDKQMSVLRAQEQPYQIPSKVYHQTSEEARAAIREQGFDISNGQARLSDPLVPDGVFFKPTASDIGLKGKVQIPAQLNIEKPFIVKDREDIIQKISDYDPRFVELQEEQKNIDKVYGAKIDKLEKDYFELSKKAWDNIKGEYRPEHKKALEVFDQETEKVFAEWEAKQKDLPTESRNILNKYLKENGYDGMVIKEDVGSFGRKTETIIALDPKQININGGY